jgi:hypothetical protein
LRSPRIVWWLDDHRRAGRHAGIRACHGENALPEAAHPVLGVDPVRPRGSPRRSPRSVASLIWGIELVVLVVAAFVLLVEPVGTRLEAEAQELASVALPETRRQSQPPRASKPVLSRAETFVIVLNGNGRPGAAVAASATVHGKGYRVNAVGNAPSANYPRSIVIYRPGYEPEARRLAKDFGVRAVGPLDEMNPRELAGSHVALTICS